ncbi:MAG: hypothetical protein HZC02_03105 [Candidatus Levybacteria bacterium]|nr:hypothetical protein [Candidatus Levybacteria bacterium]
MAVEYQVSKDSNKKIPVHYYGDTIRKLFFAAAFIMLFFLPFFTGYIPVSIRASLLIVLALSIFSGLTSPRVFFVSVIDVVISVFGVFLFGYYAVDAYMQYSVSSMFFWVNQILSIIFLVSLYFSIKTFRGFISR